MTTARMALFASALMLAGCANNQHVVFITKTSLGIDVSTEPSSASIGYDRFEGYVGPRFDNGAVPPVAASFETNGQLLGRAVRQVYATGEAARVVTSAGNPASSPLPSGPHQVMFFSTATTVGLKLGFGSTGATDNFTFGYKRREASVIPVTDGHFPAVLATIQNDVTADTRSGTEFGVQQYFATGDAAVSVAGMRQVKGMFQRRFEALDQSRHALSAASCLNALADADLPRVWEHAERHKMLKPPLNAAALKAKTAPQARDLYITALATPDESDKAWTDNLGRHKDFVCALAGR